MEASLTSGTVIKTTTVAAKNPSAIGYPCSSAPIVVPFFVGAAIRTARPTNKGDVIASTIQIARMIVAPIHLCSGTIAIAQLASFGMIAPSTKNGHASEIGSAAVASNCARRGNFPNSAVTDQPKTA